MNLPGSSPGESVQLLEPSAMPVPSKKASSPLLSLFTADNARRWLGDFADAVRREEARLTLLDAAIGDADHGINLSRVANALERRMSEPPEEALDAFFRMVSIIFMSVGGGASGPLYGSFFEGLSLHSAGRRGLCLEKLAEALHAGLERVTRLGKAVAGDKTLVDVLLPAVACLQAASLRRTPLGEALQKCATVAEAAARATIPMQAHKGRASYLGARSIGHEDPGAASAALLFRSLAEAFNAFPTPQS
jgi:dihydroxyacetone kinase-like protein